MNREGCCWPVYSFTDTFLKTDNIELYTQYILNFVLSPYLTNVPRCRCVFDLDQFYYWCSFMLLNFCEFDKANQIKWTHFHTRYAHIAITIQRTYQKYNSKIEKASIVIETTWCTQERICQLMTSMFRDMKWLILKLINWQLIKQTNY